MEIGQKSKDYSKSMKTAIATTKKAKESFGVVENLSGCPETNQAGGSMSEGRYCLNSGATSHLRNVIKKTQKLSSWEEVN